VGGGTRASQYLILGGKGESDPARPAARHNGRHSGGGYPVLRHRLVTTLRRRRRGTARPIRFSPVLQRCAAAEGSGAAQSEDGR